MKRILAIILCLVTLLSLVACAGGETATQTQEVVTKDNGKEEKETKEETKKVVVNDPLTPADLAAIPIAKPGMTTDQLRQICLDYFRLQMTFTYVPSQDYHYEVESQNLKRTLTKGKLYGGLPYVTVGSGNLYRVLEFYDSETGVLDVQPFVADYKIFGNACSGGAFTGWGRVVNSANYSWTWAMTQANGFLNVGPYKYDPTLTEIGRVAGAYSSREIVKENGKDVMFESYAACQPADGIVNPGHVRMVASAHVERVDGKIDGDKSYLVCLDQICFNEKSKYTRVQEDGTSYQIAGGADIKYTFNELYKDSYHPFTFKELLGQDPVEVATCTTTVGKTGATLEELEKATVVSNYTISDVFVEIKKPDGTMAFRRVFRNTKFNEKEVPLSKAIISTMMQNYKGSGENTIEISCQLYNGEKLVAYSGTLAI